MIDWTLESGGMRYRVRAVKRGNLMRDNGEGATGIGEALIQLVFEWLMDFGRQYKVGVLREHDRDALDLAPTQLRLLYLEVLAKGVDPQARADELRALVLSGGFDGWKGRRKSLS